MALRMLVVDDEPLVLTVFKSLVDAFGYEVLTLSDSREAARRIEMEKFDAIALDAFMPHLNGFELAERVRASRSNSGVPIILFTGQDPLDVMRRGFQAGITFFMSKPLSPEKLRGLLSAARGSMLRERRHYIRLPLKTLVTCFCAGKRFAARSVDVSQGGIMIECKGGIDVGQVVELEFALPGTPRPLKLMGKVTRQEPPNRGAVEFIEPVVSRQGTSPIIPLRELEQRTITAAVTYTGGDKLQAARLLGIGKTTLYRKLKGSAK